MAQTRCEGRFTVKGGVECDMLQLSQAVTRECASRAETEVTKEAPEAAETLTETGLEFVYRRADSEYSVPEIFTQVPLACPETEICAGILRGQYV